MKQVHLSRGAAIFLSFALLFSSFPVVAIADVLNASDFEKSCMMQSSHELYVCLDRSLSNLLNIIDEIVVVDKNISSPVHLLKKHIDDGFTFALQDEMLCVLDYAYDLVAAYSSGIGNVKKYELMDEIEQLTRCINNHYLTIDSQKLVETGIVQLLKKKDLTRSVNNFLGNDCALDEITLESEGDISGQVRSSLSLPAVVGFETLFDNPASFYVAADSSSTLVAATTDSANTAGIMLASDTAPIFGGTTALRGWNIAKLGSSADLIFDYQNSDAIGQPVVTQYTLMQLDGVNNQCELPTVGTKLIFAGDTNLYRESAHVLKTDDNFVIGTLTPNHVVITDGLTNQALSSVVTADELATLSGVTTPVQVQLDEKVDKAGDTMTGNLVMSGQSEIRLQDALGGEYVGLNAPAVVSASYTLSLPSTPPIAYQALRTNPVTPTNLEWVSAGGLNPPAVSRTIYVTGYGNDTTGDGSFASPYASLAKAVDDANSLSSLFNPIVISISPGVYVEDNSAGPITVTAEGVSIVGSSSTAVTIIPSTLSNDLLVVNETIVMANIGFLANGLSSAIGLSFTNGALSKIVNIRVINFSVGATCSGGAASSFGFDNCLFVQNGTGLAIDDAVVQCSNCIVLGSSSLVGPAANTGVTVTGSSATLIFNSGTCAICSIGIDANTNGVLTAGAVAFKINEYDIIASSAAQITLSGCNFDYTDSVGDIDVQVSGAGTVAQVVGCEFNGKSLLGVSRGTALVVSDEAFVQISGGGMSNYDKAIQIGTLSSTSSTVLMSSSLVIRECIVDIDQQGSSLLNFNAGTVSSSKILINDPVNVELAYFDLDDNAALTIGSTEDQDTVLLQANIDQMNHPSIKYLSSLYFAQAIGLENTFGDPSSWYVESADNTDIVAITTDRASIAGVRLVSDTASPVGGTTQLRGWDINKNGASAELVFNYQNSDIVGQSIVPEYTVMQLDGVNNQLQLPTAGTEIIFASDTNLYRDAADVLKTDDNFIVGTLTPDRVVQTNSSTNQLESSAVTTTELGYVSGVTSSIQTQIDSKVAKAGDTMTGALQLPAGTTALPSLKFTGSPTTGLSAAITDTLSLSTAGTERVNISPLGIVSINNLTSAGVVHNDATGLLSSSLIVNADVSASAGIVDTKLATISTAGKVLNSATTATSALSPNTIVLRDSSGDFSAGVITADLDGNATTATTAGDFTGSLVGDVTGTQSATVVSFVGGQTAANVASATVLTNAATSANTASAIVKRDSSGNFSAGIITANLTGSASNNVLKVGDTMTGALVMAAQNAVRFCDASDGEYVGINAPATIPTSYTVSLPSTVPTAHQVLRANSVTPTNLEWASEGGSALPATSRTIYVTKYGNDTTGDGSFNNPYLTLEKAISIANTISSVSNPVAIWMNSGVYIENNSMGPLAITVNGVSIVGESVSSVIIMPNTSSNDLLTANNSLRMMNITLKGSSSTAVGLSLTAGALSTCNNMRFLSFQTAVSCSGGVANSYGFSSTLFSDNNTSLSIDDTRVELNACTIFGVGSLVSPATNAGITITGSNAGLLMSGGICGLCATGFSVTGGASVTLSGVSFKLNKFDVEQDGGSSLDAISCSFELTDGATDVDLKISGAGTQADIVGCQFNGNSLGGITEGTGVFVFDSAIVTISGGSMKSYTTGIHIGEPTDTASTSLSVTSFVINDCVTDILQEGSASFAFNASTASSSKMSFNDSTNIEMAFFDLDDNSALTIGSTADQDTVLLQADIDSTNHPSIKYLSSLYSTQAMGLENLFGNPSTWYVEANDDASLAAITTDRTDSASVRLVSDTASPVGGTTALRGWDINKNGTSAELAFSYQNSDIVGQIAVPEYVVMQLDGVNNQLQLPTVGAKIIFASDTNLYRDSADVLKTDDNFIIGTLTPDRVVQTNSSTDQLESSAVTNAELGYVSGVTSSIQTQINSKVAKSGDTMTGALQLPAGTTALPSLKFTGSPTTGVTAATTDTLSLSTAGAERIKISPTGVVSINNLTSTGIVHNDATGLLSSSLIVNADVAAGAGIVDTKLATISTAGKVANSATTATSALSPNTIVLRDSSGDFSAGVITADLDGNATTATTAGDFTGSLAGDVTGTQGATVVSFVGGQTAANVASATVLANAATSANTVSAIVKRDSSGNFSAGTITANLTGSASNNVLKAGDTMTGTLVMSAQNAIQFQDASGGEYVGINAPATVPTSYTISLPSTIPTAYQVLRANSTTPTNLEWASEGGSALPTASKTIYVTKYGNDTTGNGSFNSPYLTLSKAISVVNTLSSAVNPIAIWMNSGVYVENNSAGPLAITVAGVSIVGESVASVIIVPAIASNTLLTVNNAFRMANITLKGASSSAIGLSLTAGSLSTFNNMRILNFQTGVSCSGGAANSYGFSSCLFSDNGTAISVSDARLQLIACSIFGIGSLAGPAANTGVLVTGSGSGVLMSGGVCGVCETGFNITGGSVITISSTAFKLNDFDIVQDGGSHSVVTACTFELTNGTGDIDVSVSGAGTQAEFIGCQFNGNDSLGVAQGIGLEVSDSAQVLVGGGSMNNYETGIHIGTSTDTSSTYLAVSSFVINNCVTDILQEGLATFTFNASTASNSKISINDTTNVELAFFNLDDNAALTIGSMADQDTVLLQANIDLVNHPSIKYLSSLYSAQAVGLENLFGSPSTWYVEASNNASLAAITTDRTDSASVRLVSDTALPVGGTTQLRGWDINKNGTSAELAFKYQNSDIVGQSAVPEYTVMQLDGVNNQLQLPTTGTEIIFASDTNLYRDSANVLKTDDNFIVGTLTPDRVVQTNSSTNQLESSAVTNTELGYVSGVTSSIQTQLGTKVAKAGDTMTGTLQLPAGTAALPSLVFTGSTTTGLSAATANTLSFSTAATERLKISSGGVVSINNLTSSGVVHNDASGNLSSSLIVNADITNATISNAKLATISSSNTPGNIVVRDGSGNFETNMITLLGTPTNGTDAVTKTYVDSMISAGLSAKTPALVVSTTNVSSLSGLQTIDGVTLVANNRVLLVGQTNTVNNGLWLAQSGGWTRPSDFAALSTAGQAYVLITSGTVNAGSSWLCTTPLSIVGVTGITFVQFSLPDTTTGANVGTGTGLVYQTKSGVTLNFRSLLAGTHFTITTNTDDVTFTTDATNANTASTIVARDASGNFSAGTITANLTGSASNNVLKAGDTMTGALQLLAGTAAAPSLVFTGSTTTGLSAAVADTLSLSTAGTQRMTISPSGVVAINGFTAAGVVHNDASGLLSSSLIVNADVSASAAIVDTKLATISTAGKISNSATTATSLNTASTIVSRDASGNFNAGTIIASLMGSASDNVLKAGDTMTGALQLPAGTAAAPSLVFTGSTTSGLFADSGDLLLSTSGVQRLKISSSGTISIDSFTAAGVVHNDSSGNLSSSLIVNADVSTSAAIVDTKLATIATAGKVANSATTATSANTASAIVARDSSGNFSAGTITATLSGTATNFSGSLVGDVTGTQSATVVSTVGGQTASNVAAATILANAATNNNTASTIVKRDSTGSFSAQVVSLVDEVASGSLTIIPFSSAGVVHNSASGLLSTSLIVNADVSASAGIVDTKLATISTAGKVSNSATTATSSNTASAIVARDGFGNFSAGTITADLIGNATTSTSTTNFSGSLLGDVTGVQSATVVSLVGGQTASDVAAATALANAATSANTASTIVKRDASGNFSAGTIIASLSGNATTATTATNFSGSLVGDVTGTQGATVVSFVGGQTAANVVAATVLANAATSANTASTIVRRDASGNFNAGTIIASLMGSASNNVLKAGDTMTGTLQLPAGTAALPSLVFTGSTTSGLFANSGDLSLSTNGAQRLKISSAGVISVDAFTTAGVVHNDASGNLSSSLIANADVSASAGIVDTKLATISTAGKVANSATSATSANTASAIVARDASGNFSAGTITATLSGTATNFSGSLVGDVTGTQGATVVSAVGGQTASNVAAATVLANAATNNNTASTIVKRDSTGSFSAQVVSLVDEVASGTVTISPFSSAGVVHNDTTGLLSSSLIVNADVSASAGIVDTKLATISTAGKVANSATTATSSNTVSTIVARDNFGNFTAGTITADLIGNATTSTSTTSFTGSLVGDVTGTQGATVVSAVGGQTASNVAAATVLANAATSANTASAIVRRDASGNFSAGTITASLSGNATTATTATNFSGSLVGDVTGTQGATVVSSVGGQAAANVAAATVLANAATSANTASTIVRRDASGNFNAGTIVASLMGSASDNVLKAGDTMTGALQLPAGNAAAPSLIFTGSTTSGLFASSGDLSLSTNGTQRLKISSGGVVSINAFATAGVVHNDTSGNLSSSLIVNADVSASAGIVDTKLATISTAGKVANSATSATNANTASAIVARDASGNFTTNMITIAGTVTNATDVATKGYVDSALVTGTNLNTPNAVVKRDGTGSFAAQTVSVVDTVASGTITVSAGTAALPSFKFSGSTNTGFSAATADRLSFDTNGVERMSISTTAVTVPTPFILGNIICNQAIQTFTVTGNGQSISVTSGISILLLSTSANRTNFTITMPASPLNGQLLSIMTTSTNSIGLLYNGNGATVPNPITSIDADASLGANAGGASITYLYVTADNAWYRYFRG